MPDYDDRSDVIELLQTETVVAEAPLYTVLMHDDPVTTMEFVVTLLVDLFGYGRHDAFELMYLIHNSGVASVATLPRERAEKRARQTMLRARANGFPLTCTIEPDC